MPLAKIKKSIGALAIWKSVVNLLLSKPKLLLPYLFLAIIESFALWFLSLSPHFPFSVILGPPIKSIWGGMYMHYPFNYDLLPKMFYYSKIIIDILIGAVTSGMAILMVVLFKKKEGETLKVVFFSVLKKYITLVILAVVLYGSVHFIMKQPPVLLFKFFRAGHAKLLFLGPKFWFSMFLPVFNFVLVVLLQGLFVYSFPYAVLKGKKFLPALVLGARLFFRRFFKTVFVVIVPLFLYIPVTILREHMNVVADIFSPEAVVVVLLIGILVGTVVVDALITITTTLVFIEATADET